MANTTEFLTSPQGLSLELAELAALPQTTDAYGLISTLESSEGLGQSTISLLESELEKSFSAQSSLVGESSLEGLTKGLEQIGSVATTAALTDIAETAVDPLTGQADLVTVAFDVITDHVLAGQITLSFMIQNQGTADVAAFEADVVYADTSVLGDATDAIIQTLAFDGLAAGAAITQTLDLQLPQDLLYQRALAEDPPQLAPGTGSNNRDYVGLVLDPNDAIAELNEDNNLNQGQGQDGDDITYFPWDIDRNGTVTATDAIYVVNRIGSADTQADFDGTGQVSATDAIAVINRLGYTIDSEVIKDPNVAAIAMADFVSTPEDAELFGNVFQDNGLGVDSDVNGDPFTVIDNTLPANGSLILDVDGTFSYRPNPNFFGQDTFEYTIADGQGGENQATVSITVEPVNDAPSPVKDFFRGLEDNPITGNLLSNDTDPEGDPLQVIAVSNPQNGSITSWSSDGSFTYTPNLNYWGDDSFTYTVSDGIDSVTAIVDLFLDPINDAPEANDDNYTVGDVTSITRNVLANDIDVDGPNLTVTDVTNGTHGRVVINPDGTVTYAPNPTFIGNDSFTYTVSDGELEDTGTVNITVEGITLFDNTNTNTVFNQPLAGPTFSINRPYVVNSLYTYHWNNGQGDIPQGGFFLVDNQGNSFGAWDIQTSSGSGGAPNVDWNSKPLVGIPVGTYTVFDPSPGTWSQNAQSGNAGFARVIGRPTDVVVSDTEFFPSNWVTQALTATNGATESIRQGFWPQQNNVRGMIHNQPPANSVNTDLLVFHEYQGASYTPANSGEILALNYAEDFIHFNPPFTGAQIAWRPAIRQNGQVYLGPANVFSHFDNTNDPIATPFATGQILDLDETDFVAFGGSGANPDFSATGGTITFGYVRGTTHTGPVPEIRDHGIDNWNFVLTTR
jgi:hypothetical protein